MPGEPIRLLHVTGTGRSGSTLLGGLLGQVKGFFNAGELGYLWDRGLAADGVCGCGEPIRDCPVWQEVVDRAFGGPDAPEVAELSRLHTLVNRGRQVTRLHLTGGSPGAARDYALLLGRVIGELAAVTGAEVIVDTTKPVTYAAVLERVGGLDLRLVQLVRDPRAVAWSWLRRKPGMESRPALTTGLLWLSGNAAARAMLTRHPALTVRYEDLMADPAQWLTEIVRLAGGDGAPLPLTGPATAELAPTHTVSGNVDRHRVGEVPLLLDDEWYRRMSPPRKLLVEAVTYPIRRRYGYRRLD